MVTLGLDGLPSQVLTQFNEFGNVLAIMIDDLVIEHTGFKFAESGYRIMFDIQFFCSRIRLR